MTHPVIKTDNYILITSDELVEKNYGYSPKSNEIFYYTKDFYGKGHESWVNIIAHLPLNNSPIVEGVPLLPALPNEEDFDKKLLTEEYEQALKRGGSEYAGGYCEGLFDGFEKAKEKYKFTEEDMIKVIDYCKYNRAFEYDFEKVMESLSQPKLPVGFKCAMETSRVPYGDDGWKTVETGYKIINGVLQGEWIYYCCEPYNN